MKNRNTTIIATSSTTTSATTTAATTTAALPMVEFHSESALSSIESPAGMKVESWGAVFRIMREDHFQAAMAAAAAHGRDGGMPPQQW